MQKLLLQVSESAPEESLGEGGKMFVDFSFFPLLQFATRTRGLRPWRRSAGS